MDELENRQIHTTDDELDTTAPTAPSEEWQMPEPVFRRSSGRLAKGIEEEAADVFAHASEEPVSDQQGVVAAPAFVEPSPKSSVLKIVVVALAIGAMIAFIVLFLTVVYFFFFYRSETPI